ncbi:tetratricopeptide repeat protein [Streptomyces sp. OF3]|uniref:Tetratricopeptide repeat protein n=1 Tax=Streptomyces alkaliterrae TaxID=2213162 RepID=A0A7W3WL49_9ACTN|nr:BTAD domain-containing putative transcriptional regulator [Streptomyces alkaliterrae]MBB1254318.1 tetratricopeptide repeat protein [Streptomyces alkaliterrae]
MYFSVLGPVTARTVDGGEVDIPEAKVRALLAMLLADAGRTVPVDRLVDGLWGERLPRNPAGALQTKVSRLRRALRAAGPGAEALVESTYQGYRLRIGPKDLDSRRFTDLAAEAAEQTHPRVRVELLTEALTLWRAEPFSALGVPQPVRAEAERLSEQRLTVLEMLAEARLELGEHHSLAGELGELAARHPLRERLWALRITALYRAGRQSEALAAYSWVRERLADELGVDPGPELAALHQAVLTQDPALGAPPAPTAAVPEPRRSAHEAPGAALADLIGRQDALSAVCDLLGTHRLVTLIGPGGVGKTRLAREAARQVAADHPDGVRMVGLAGSTDVTEQIGAALGVREEGLAGLEAALRARRLLLVDNCEHLIESAAEAARRLLTAAPGLTILATSREPLGLAGEAVWTVPPLTQRDAERLFAARAAAAVPGFTVTAADAEAVATICRRLDRSPLALELAATRVRALGVQTLAARLDDRFRLLSGGTRGVPPRQRSLKAVIDWSWGLLNEQERQVLRSLAVFTDGCTIEAAEAVCPDDLDVLGALIRLVDCSVLTTVDGPRYHLPETVAAYACERLAETREADALHQRHHAYYAELAARTAAGLHGPEQQRWLAHRDPENGNLRTALDRAVRREDTGQALRLVLDSVWYWYLRGRLREARRSLADVLRLGGDAPGGLRAQALLWHAGFARLTGQDVDGSAAAPAPAADSGADGARAEWFLGHAYLKAGEDLARSETLVDRALEGSRASGDRWGVAAAQSSRSLHALLRGDLTAAKSRAQEAHILFAELGDSWGRLQTTYPLAALAAIAGDYTLATQLHRDGLRLAQDLGFWADAADRITGLGRVALLVGDFAEATELHRNARALAAEHGYAAGEIHAEIGLALGARRQGDFDLAGQLLDKALAWHREVEFGPGPALLLAELGFLAEQRGDVSAALAWHRQGLAVARESQDPRAVALAQEGLAGAHALAGGPERAARLLGTATRARELVGAPLPDAERDDVERITARILAVLETERFSAEFSTDADGDADH